MKKIYQGAGMIVLGAFTLVIIAFMAMMNYKTLGRIFADDPMQQAWGMALFSGGTLCWFVIFLQASRGFQRSIALVMFCISLAGEVFYSAADVLQGGQSWVTVDASLGQYVIYFFILMTFAHGAALYAHFFMQPTVQAGIDVEALEDEIKQKAQDRATELVNERVEPMAETLARRAAGSVYVNLRLPMPKDIIDAVAQDVQEATETAKSEGSFGDFFAKLMPSWMKNPGPPVSPAPPVDEAYTLDQMLADLGMSADEMRKRLAQYGLQDKPDVAYNGLIQSGMAIPTSLTRDVFRELHRELFSSVPEAAPAVGANFQPQPSS